MSRYWYAKGFRKQEDAEAYVVSLVKNGILNEDHEPRVVAYIPEAATQQYNPSKNRWYFHLSSQCWGVRVNE